MKKIAVVFPGVGYHADKPLLYYSRKIAGQYGYEIICADYGQLPSGIKGDAKKMYAAYELALAKVTEQFSGIDFGSYDKVSGPLWRRPTMLCTESERGRFIIPRWKRRFGLLEQKELSSTEQEMTGRKRKPLLVNVRKESSRFI